MKRFPRLSAPLLALALMVPQPETAQAQAASNMVLRSNLDQYSTYNDIWGYTHTNGVEYALLGTTTGTSVINISNPDMPVETGFIPGPTSTWRDIKTYQTYAYVTNETSGGIEIIDLTDPENPGNLANYTGISTAHNLFIDETTGLLYTAGSNLGAGGTRILSLASPTNPVEVGNWETVYFHDIMVQNDVAYGSAINNATLYILDVSNLGSITTLGTKSGYPHAFTHNAWVTADGNHVMTTDETVGAAARLWDISSLPTITETDNYLPNAATIPHNAHIDGNLAIISHYTLGVRVVDITNPNNIVEVGFYDTWPADDGGSFNGCWGAFPFFPNTPDLIIASDISTGLYVLENKVTGTVSGTVTHSGIPAATIAGASLQIVETGVSSTSDAAGSYSIVDGVGNVTLQASAFAYQTASVPVTISAGATTTTDVQLVPVPGGSVSGNVTDAVSGLPIAGASVEVLSTPLVQTSDVAGAYTHYSVPTGSYTVRASAFGYNSLEIPVSVSNGGAPTVDFALNTAAVALDFESGVAGWTTGGTASTGMWELGDPQATEVQPEDDHTPAPGTDAWITQLAAGSSVGSFDIDNGVVILTSPAFDLTGLADPYFSYHRWYSTGVGGGNSTVDDFVVEVSSNGGSTWSLVERTNQDAQAWTEVSGQISALVTPSSQVVFRFTAQDTGAGSITEAGMDDFMIHEIDVQSSQTGAPVIAQSADVLSLGANAPNPFRAGETTSLSFTLPAKGPVSASVYDVSGRKVADLVNGVFTTGAHRLEWDGRTRAGSPAPAGVYFLKLQTQAGNRARKMLVVR